MAAIVHWRNSQNLGFRQAPFKIVRSSVKHLRIDLSSTLSACHHFLHPPSARLIPRFVRSLIPS